MSWEDTVLDDKQLMDCHIEYMDAIEPLKPLPYNESVAKKVSKAQAEISFRAGVDEGRREVIDFLLMRFNVNITLNQLTATNTWQAQLKSWGIT